MGIHIPIGRHVELHDLSGPFPKRVAYDIEVYPNFFSCAVADIDSNRLIFYEISERKNDFKAMFQDFKKYKYCVSWNGLAYDSVVLMKLFERINNTSLPDYKTITRYAYAISCELIEDEHRMYVNRYWREIDLFLYWSQLIRRAKKLSLKSMANFIRWPWIQELPITPGSYIKVDQIDDLLSYNGNDALITKELSIGKMKKDIEFRFATEKDFGINALCSDGVKIGMDYLKLLYAKRLGISPRDIPKFGTEHKLIKVEDIFFHDRFEAGTSELKKAQDKYLGSILYPGVEGISHKLILPQKWQGKKDDLVIKLGTGGIHTDDKPAYLHPPKGYVYVASDVKSYYPNILFGNMLCPAHLDIAFTLVYRDELYPDKDKAKLDSKDAYKQFQETGDPKFKVLSEYYDNKRTLVKLALNGATGNLRNPYSWIRDDAVNLAITINGQFMLAMLAEWCIARGWRVVSMNTDGIEVMVPEKEIDDYMEVCRRWDEQCNVELEHDFYSRVFRTSVNDYIAVDIHGKVKGKGDYELYKDMTLDKSPEYMAIPHAIHEYVMTGRSVSESIMANDNIFEFCAFPKPAKKYSVFWGSDEVNRLNRFYLSKQGRILKKWNNENGAVSSIVAGDTVMLYNKHLDQSIENYGVNKNWYIRKAQQIIDSVIVKQQTLF